MINLLSSAWATHYTVMNNACLDIPSLTEAQVGSIDWAHTLHAKKLTFCCTVQLKQKLRLNNRRMQVGFVLLF